MSERRSLLRAAVNERLAAAAEEIFVLLERTIAEYEEEVCRSKEENQRNQQLLEALRPRVSVDQGSSGSDPETTVRQERPEIKEEPSEHRLKEEAEESLKQEEEQLLDFTAVCVKSEEQSSLIEDREEAQGQLCGGADISSQTHLHSETEEQRHDSYTDHDEDYDGDHDEDWGHPGSSSTAQMQTEAEGNLYNQVHSQGLSGTGPRDLLSGTGPRDLLSGTGPRDLLSDLYNRVHTQDSSAAVFSKYRCGAEKGRPYSCPFCNKTFTYKTHYSSHLRIHTGKRPYSCSVCKKRFKSENNLVQHIKVHTGETSENGSVSKEKYISPRRNAHNAAFKLKAIELADKEGNRAAARKLGIHESMVRRWKGQRDELMLCKKTTKAFRGQKSRWPELENILEDWVTTQRADSRGVSTMQIRLKAQTIATEKNITDFRGGPSWCLRFMRRKGLSIRERPALCQRLPLEYEEKLTHFRCFTQTTITKNSFGADDIINMDEVPLTFDMPLTRRVNKKGESSITLKTTGHARTHFTCVLSCTASGHKLPPMVIFKRRPVPEEPLPQGIVVRVNQRGWMEESLMRDWMVECLSQRPGGVIHRRALLVMDSMRAHVTESVRAEIQKNNCIPAVIPADTTKHLQPLDVSVKRAFKVSLRAQWETWMTSGDKSFTKTGHMRRASLAQVCQWVLMAWSSVRGSTITSGFRQAGLLCDEEEDEEDASDSESEDETDTEKVCDEVLLGLFDSDTEDDDFDGFSAEEEEEEEEWLL